MNPTFQTFKKHTLILVNSLTYPGLEIKSCQRSKKLFYAEANKWKKKHGIGASYLLLY